MKLQTVTIKDIAIALNVSKTTVSRALNGENDISERTKRRILDFATQNNYSPNPSALRLQARRSYAIGVIVSEIANDFFSQAINGMESVAYKSGYHVIITQSSDSYSLETQNINHLVAGSVDGLLISLASGTMDTTYLKKLRADGLPIVFFDRISPEIDTHKVLADNFKGAFEATEHLINSGCKRIVYLGSSSHLTTSKERFDGYKVALEKSGLPLDEHYVNLSDGRHLQEKLDATVLSLLNRETRPDGFFIAQDKLCMGFLLAVQKFEPAFFSKIAIAGFTNSNDAGLLQPNITVVRQPAFEIGKEAMTLLIKQIESKEMLSDLSTKVLDTQLIVNA